MNPNMMLWIHQLFSEDETLLRLLFYKAKSIDDDVTDNKRKDILSGTPVDKYLSGVNDEDPVTKQEIISDRIKPYLKFTDLKEKEKIRITYHAGEMEKTTNLLFQNYHFTVTIFVHENIEEKDFRTIRIINRVNDQLLKVGLPRPERRLKPTFLSGSVVELLDGYSCYQLNYKI
jgi:hypothetical protein